MKQLPFAVACLAICLLSSCGADPSRMNEPQVEQVPVEPTELNEYQEILAVQLAMNPGTWERLQAHGVTEETTLQLEFLFYCPDEESALLLEKLLQGYEYESQVSESLDSENNTWVLNGVTCPTALSLSLLDDWVQWMVVAGMEYQCKFDGWGASI